jgi:hypothetical protein
MAAGMQAEAPNEVAVDGQEGQGTRGAGRGPQRGGSRQSGGLWHQGCRQRTPARRQ